MARARRGVPADRRFRNLDRGRPAHRDAGAPRAPTQARLQPPELRRAGLRRRRAAGGAPRPVVRDGRGPDDERARARLRVDQRRPDLRPAEADPGELRAHGAADRRAAPRPHRAVRLRAPARALQAAAPHRRRRPAEPRPQRIAMLGDAISGFLARGYGYIGMDHFALPDDSLAVAKREGRLHRNFQGYSTQPDCDLVALGVSAIGRVGAAYYQNAKTLPEYYEALAQAAAAGRPRLRARRRRRAAARRHHGADVPGPGRIRADRTRARRARARATSPTSSRRCARWPNPAWSRSSTTRYR